LVQLNQVAVVLVDLEVQFQERLQVAEQAQNLYFQLHLDLPTQLL
jgi:hypothetical protein